MKDIKEIILTEFNNRIRIEKKRPEIFQLYLPLYHEDGDMIDLFLSINKEGKYILSDFGLTLQRLAYSYDIDSENKERILGKILSENHINDENGNLTLITSPETVLSDIFHITNVFSKVSAMGYFKREMIENLFIEMLDKFIYEELVEFKPDKDVKPIPDRSDLVVDYSFSPNGHPIYLFGVKDSNKAKLTTISCLEFQKANLNYRGWVVNENFDLLPKNDRTRLTNACDKQFTSLEEFKASAKLTLERERK